MQGINLGVHGRVGNETKIKHGAWHRVFLIKGDELMKRSKSDIVLAVFKIILLVLITVHWVLFLSWLLTTDTEQTFAGLVHLILLIYSLIYSGGAFLFSFAFLVAALYMKKVFVKKADKEAEGYEKCLKIKKGHVLHFSLLMGYAVVSEIAIFIVGNIIF